ncbi:MAG: hypothetical protein ACR2HH_16595 [Chthoniobacterales bacterium]
MTNLFHSRIVRFLIVVIAALGWLAISNHCAIAAMEGSAKMPMPACHGSVGDHKSPAKDHHEGDVECCKVLRATLLTVSKNAAAFDHFQFVLQTYVTAILPSSAERNLQSPLELDTGPPFVGSFAESVLQRSILAHAPPSLA